ncbi:alpha/beta hydrolase [Natronococcus pandeyae]|uniref:Alpha/beta hydrolase n=1 Tax=Natronococcus pandeyae TaxID=2055836 RepID=A0A8J8Q0A7_9EURY|nr:alpha/beta hydrolase [Natronococcus pandeyae]TYL36947.1 alpha/beta hydrolase [Natronococcus pandeyae]
MNHASDELDPELEGVIEAIQAAGVPPWHSLSVESARRIEDEVFSSGSGPEMRSVRNLRIDGPGGDLPIRVYRPHAERPSTLVFYHGGGWTLGTLDSADDICRELAARAECLVLSVDYRLAPEHPFPAAVDDAYAALEWAADYADSLGGDPGRLGVAGTSAGGNLAATTALRARDAGPALAGQFLLYPMTDRSFDRDSYREHGDGPLLTEEGVRWFWNQYLRSPVDEHNPFATVLRAPDLSDVAPATVATAGHDVLRDEGTAYAEKLSNHGVPTEYDHYPTLTHGFFSLTDVERADEAMDALAENVRSRLG